ncbi:MAG TPA: STAS domain-containing protein [Bryobacteraceae bacterium]|nr:STAS domain-containing protein [Bryobacteraceae bacterium]
MNEFNMEVLGGDREGERFLKLAGPFTLAAVFDFQASARKDVTPVTFIDLTEVPFVDSAALGSLLGLHVSCQRDGRQYGLIGAPERVRTLFRVAGVDGVLRVFPSLDEAEGGTRGLAASA